MQGKIKSVGVVDGDPMVISVELSQRQQRAVGLEGQTGSAGVCRDPHPVPAADGWAGGVLVQWRSPGFGRNQNTAGRERHSQRKGGMRRMKRIISTLLSLSLVLSLLPAGGVGRRGRKRPSG